MGDVKDMKNGVRRGKGVGIGETCSGDATSDATTAGTEIVSSRVIDGS